jgi:hypothetical protein
MMEICKKGLSPQTSFHTLVPVPKPALGRDLRALLGSNPKPDAAPEPLAPVSAGVRSLMRGSPPPATGLPSRPLIPRWYLWAGDALLVALALITVCASPHPLSWRRELFCAGVVILAAVLAVLAVLPPDKA